ncbi:MAG: uroporphyrinogen-III C-methyltransferase [Solirubrobacterales bacterium]
MSEDFGSAKPGTVYLVGGGPGDPGLMTLRGAALLASADVVLYDRLIGPSALSDVRSDALLEFAGKGSRGDSSKQAQIDARMIELAREGKSVVRLKGGDPLVFGRGGEEATALAAAEVSFEIVPGVTAGVAAAAYAGVPVTHRDHAAAVAFVTGHEDPNRPESAIDWSALAAFPGTLVFYMGVKNLPQISEQLIEAGRSADESAAVIAQGTRADQRTVIGRLVDIPELAREAAIDPPALTVIGSVVEERQRIEWFERRPLFGRRVVVTRARAQAGTLAGRLRALGAEVVESPAISVRFREDQSVRAAIEQISSFDLVAFTSVNGVQSFFAALGEAALDARALGGIEFATVGAATAEELRNHGVIADHLPDRAVSEGLLDLFGGVDLAGKRVLLAVASESRHVLGEGLVELGAEVHKIAFYDTIHEPLDDEQVAAVTEADFITFASGSAVHSLVESIGGAQHLKAIPAVSIGPTTSAALREHGLEPSAEATRHEIDGLIDALLQLR